MISVVIPHFNQPDALELCLQSLVRQRSVTKTAIEIVVVDNGSAELPTAVKNYQDVRLEVELRPGPGPARNKGIAVTTGDIVAFVDADCVSDAHWLERIEHAFKSAAVSIIGGQVTVPYKTPGQPSFNEPYERVYAYRNEMYIASGFSGAGNMAARRSVFDAVGEFSGIEVAEDREWGLRAKAQGYKTIYVEDMIVYHPARESFNELTRKWDRQTAHDFADLRSGLRGRLMWIAKALGLLASPFADIPKLATTAKLGSNYERWLAFRCLLKIRVYRCQRMLALLLLRSGRESSTHWRGEDTPD